MLWAMKDAPVADVQEWAVLVCLGEYATDDGCNAWPSVSTIAARTRLSTQCVSTRLKALKTRRLIAPGDQSKVEHIPADRRPVVYDLLIPLSWHPSLERVQAYRHGQGLAMFTAGERPDLGPAPAKKVRADKGTKRSGVSATSPADGVTTSVGVSTTSERGIYQSSTGHLVDAQPNQVTNPSNQPPCERPASQPPNTTTELETLIPGLPADPADPATRARAIVGGYIDWVKQQNGGRILDSTSMFHGLTRMVTNALRDGWTEAEIKLALADCFHAGHEFPSAALWRQKLTHRESTLNRRHEPTTDEQVAAVLRLKRGA